MRGCITPQIRRLADIRQAMAHIARAEIAVGGLCIHQIGIMRQELLLNHTVQIIRRSATGNGNILTLIHSIQIVCDRRLQVGFRQVVDATKVKAGFAVAL